MEPTEHRVNANGIEFAYLACGDADRWRCVCMVSPTARGRGAISCPSSRRPASCGGTLAARLCTHWSRRAWPLPERRASVADAIDCTRCWAATRRRCSSGTTGGRASPPEPRSSLLNVGASSSPRRYRRAVPSLKASSRTGSCGARGTCSSSRTRSQSWSCRLKDLEFIDGCGRTGRPATTRPGAISCT